MEITFFGDSDSKNKELSPPELMDKIESLCFMSKLSFNIRGSSQHWLYNILFIYALVQITLNIYFVDFEYGKGFSYGR